MNIKNNKVYSKHLNSSRKETAIDTDTNSGLFSIFWLKSNIWCIFIIVLLGIALFFSSRAIMTNHLQQNNPERIYGDWVELNAPPFQTQTITFNTEGVFRNYRFIATQFIFNGQTVSFTTGGGQATYRLSKETSSPRLVRISPLPAGEIYLKKGAQLDSERNQSQQKRRALISRTLNTE